MVQLNDIKKLVPYLPVSEIPYAEKFIKERNFQSLYDIVNSTLIKIERSCLKGDPKEEYLNLDIDKIEELKLYCFEYKEQLDYEPDELYDDFL